jgi:hypothetical protein
MYVIIQIREAEKNVVRKEETKLNTFIAEEQSLERNPSEKCQIAVDCALTVDIVACRKSNLRHFFCLATMMHHFRQNKNDGSPLHTRLPKDYRRRNDPTTLPDSAFLLC